MCVFAEAFHSLVRGLDRWRKPPDEPAIETVSVPVPAFKGQASGAQVVLLDASGEALDDLWARLLPNSDLCRCLDLAAIPDDVRCAVIALPVGIQTASVEDLFSGFNHRTAAAIDRAGSISICLVWIIPDDRRPDALISHDYRTGEWVNAYRLGRAAAWTRQRAAVSSERDALCSLDARLAALLELPSHRKMLAGNTVAVLDHARRLSGDRCHVVLLTQSAVDVGRWHGEQWLDAAVRDLLQCSG